MKQFIVFVIFVFVALNLRYCDFNTGIDEIDEWAESSRPLQATKEIIEKLLSSKGQDPLLEPLNDKKMEQERTEQEKFDEYLEKTFYFKGNQPLLTDGSEFLICEPTDKPFDFIKIAILFSVSILIFSLWSFKHKISGSWEFLRGEVDRLRSLEIRLFISNNFSILTQKLSKNLYSGIQKGFAFYMSRKLEFQQFFIRRLTWIGTMLLVQIKRSFSIISQGTKGSWFIISQGTKGSFFIIKQGIEVLRENIRRFSNLKSYLWNFYKSKPNQKLVSQKKILIEQEKKVKRELVISENKMAGLNEKLDILRKDYETIFEITTKEMKVKRKEYSEMMIEQNKLFDSQKSKKFKPHKMTPSLKKLKKYNQNLIKKLGKEISKRENDIRYAKNSLELEKVNQIEFFTFQFEKRTLENDIQEKKDQIIKMNASIISIHNEIQEQLNYTLTERFCYSCVAGFWFILKQLKTQRKSCYSMMMRLIKLIKLSIYIMKGIWKYKTIASLSIPFFITVRILKRFNVPLFHSIVASIMMMMVIRELYSKITKKISERLA